MRGGEGLYGRPQGGGGVVFTQNGSERNWTRAATDVDGLVGRVRRIGGPLWSPNAHQPKPGSQAGGRAIRRGEGG